MQNLIFDLDGTLVDSRESIHASLNHALRTLGFTELDFIETQSHIGSPLMDIFCSAFDMSTSKADEAIGIYRDHYARHSAQDTRVYPMVAETLADLQGHGFRLFIATVKPGPVARKVLDEQGFLPYFDGISGSSMDSSRKDKVDIISHAINKNRLSAEHSVMIGDRFHDINGAHENQMASIGVSYGYGSHQELQDAGAHHIIDCISQLPECVLQWNNST